MQSSTVTSIRLPVPLKHELEEVAHRLKRRPNWVIMEALREYVRQQKDNTAFVEQVRKDSLRAAELEQDPEFWDQELWERNIDTTGWV